MSGLLGLLFRFYDDPIGILMPSAGLALASVLLFGYHVIPGLVIGGFFVNVWAFDFKQGFLVFYIASAFGSAITAYVGALLIRKKIGFPNTLIDLKSIVTFMLLGGVLSCTLSASVSSASMRYSRIIDTSQIPAAWISWWLADVLGVLIFTPIILTFFAQPYLIWCRRRTTVGIPVMFSFFLVFLLFCYMQAVSRNRYNDRLKENAELLSQVLVKRIRLDLDALNTVRNLVRGSKKLETEDFSVLTRQALMPFKEMRSISWISFNEEDPKKNIYIQMLNENEPVKLEVLKNIPLEIKKKWQETGSALETEIFVTEGRGFELSTPLVKETNRRQEITDVLIADILMEKLIREVLDGLNANNCAITVSASLNAGPEKKIIFSNTMDASSTAYEVINIPVANQVWRMEFYHDWSKAIPVHDRSIEWIVFDGLCVTGLLGMLLLHITGRYFRAEALIEERTNTLTEMKASAESANNAKNQFLAKISHELRTPLNGISGFTQLLEKKPTLNAEDKKHVAIIKQCSDNLLRLINDILDISAIESRQLKTEMGEFDYETLLTDSINIFKFRADEKGLKLISESACSERKFIGDEKRLRQILANLIDNAIKYTSQGSVTISSRFDDGKLQISVADTGCGIGQNNLDKIFSPFVQIDGGNLSREGVGLGLPITKELVLLMNGDLTVNSELGRGSIFSVEIPLQACVTAKNKTPSIINPDSKYGQRRVLVVDDSEINLLFLI